MHKAFTILLLLAQNPGLASSPEEQVDRLHEICYEYLDSHPDSALIFASEAKRLASEAGYAWGEANSLYIQGYIHYLSNELSRALVDYLQAESVLRPIDDPKFLKTRVDLLLNCGVILFDSHHYQQALNFYQEALKLTEGFSDLSKARGEIYYNIGMAYRHLGDLNLAIENTVSALNIFQTLPNQSRLDLWNQLGLIYKDNRDYPAARKAYRTILTNEQAQQELGEYAGRAHHNIAVTFYDEHHYDSARYHYQRALELKMQTHVARDIFITLLDLTELYLAQGDYQAAKETGLSAQALYEEVPLKRDYFMLFNLLSKTHYALKEYDAAALYAERFVQESTRCDEMQQEVLKLKEQYEIEQTLAGFYAEQESQRKISARETTLQVISAVLLSIILCIIVIQQVRKRLLRSALERELRNIENSSFI